ncbi:hypothetical protein FRC02_006347 [Tulasnella sp. 418]|nr:hypothetical protein FRC02_006347 [Tulasnella sp. 418]
MSRVLEEEKTHLLGQVDHKNIAIDVIRGLEVELLTQVGPSSGITTTWVHFPSAALPSLRQKKCITVYNLSEFSSGAARDVKVLLTLTSKEMSYFSRRFEYCVVFWLIVVNSIIGEADVDHRAQASGFRKFQRTQSQQKNIDWRGSNSAVARRGSGPQQK